MIKEALIHDILKLAAFKLPAPIQGALKNMPFQDAAKMLFNRIKQTNDPKQLQVFNTWLSNAIAKRNASLGPKLPLRAFKPAVNQFL